MSASAAPSTVMPFLAATSANAIVSDLRPTTVSPAALNHINLFLDEILSSLVTSARSINPSELRVSGIPIVFTGDRNAGESTGPRSLGRSAVGEAEMELRSWFDQNRGQKIGFPPAGKGRGMTEVKERAEAKFPDKEAIQLLRIKCASFSTIASEVPFTEQEEQVALLAWRNAGGDTSETTIDPAALWMTAIIEHVCEHVLAQLSSVVARDSGATVAGVQELMTALGEDEMVYGFFKRMKVKESLETAIRAATPRSKRILGSLNGSPHGSKTSLVSTPSRNANHSSSPALRKSSLPPTSDSRPSGESGRLAYLSRKVSYATRRSPEHDRAPSVLSVNTRSMLGAYNDGGFDSDDSREKSPQQDQDEFDALVRSGETMKVSLTPSRLKHFELPDARKKGHAASPPYVRRTRATSAATAPPALPKSESMPLMSGQTTPTRPKVRSRASSGSARKLVARGATTIEEGDDEEGDVDDGDKPRKASLKDMLDLEPPEELPSPSKRTSSPTKRTVPAVILGSPPPLNQRKFDKIANSPPPPARTSPATTPGPSTSTMTTPATYSHPPRRRASPTKPSVNRPDREFIEEDEEDDFGRPRPKPRMRSDAQELADFLNSTPPPPPISTSRTAVTDPPPSSKSNRSFKSLMSKIKGGKKEDETAEPPILEEIPTAPKPPKRVKSTATMSFAESARTAPAAPSRRDREWDHNTLPTIPQTSARRPSPPQAPHSSSSSQSGPRVLRKKSDATMTATLAAAAGTGAVAGGLVASAAAGGGSPEKRDLERDLRGKENHPPTAAPVDKSSPTRTPPTVSNSPERPTTVRTTSMNRTPHPTDTHVPTPAPASAPSEEIVFGKAPDVERAQDATASSTSKPTGTSTNTPYMERVPTETSDMNSFITAEEGDDTAVGPGDSSTSLSDSRSVETPKAVPADVQPPSEPIALPAPVGTTGPGTHRRYHSVPVGVSPPAAAAPQDDHDLVEAEEPEPSIPISRLVGLRGLLDHATSARECRMLLSAILTQFGVPMRPEGEVEDVTSEFRLAAWLLAGGFGSVDLGAISSATSSATGVVEAPHEGSSEHLNQVHDTEATMERHEEQTRRKGGVEEEQEEVESVANVSTTATTGTEEDVVPEDEQSGSGGATASEEENTTTPTMKVVPQLQPTSFTTPSTGNTDLETPTPTQLHHHTQPLAVQGLPVHSGSARDETTRTTPHEVHAVHPYPEEEDLISERSSIISSPSTSKSVYGDEGEVVTPTVARAAHRVSAMRWPSGNLPTLSDNSSGEN